MSQPERYCDIVMKGGVTSGIIYPFAISKLSTQYRFRSIGGTSAGAIAAAIAAAAEYQRRQTGSEEGFNELDRLPNELSIRDDKGRSKLFRLFKPQPGTKPLFLTIVGALDRRSISSRLFFLFFGALAHFPLYGAAGALLFGGLGYLSYHPCLPFNDCSGGGTWLTWLPILLLAVFGSIPGLLLAVYFAVSKNVTANGFGLCNGHADTAAFTKIDKERVVDEELTDWLHGVINRSAGRCSDDPPLTFGELWSAPGFPPDWLAPFLTKPTPSIDLQMMTTNVTHGRPYRLPFQDSNSKLFFRPAELKKYLPEVVSRWMEDHQGRYEPSESDPQSLPEGLLPIPTPADFPVVVAARLSLSYPILISALPLWAIDYEAPREDRTFERCWFSDGGISSNFPVHFFDGLLPLWPTFGVKLEGFPKGYSVDPDNRIYMPYRNEEGRADSWDRFDEQRGFKKFTGFLSATIAAMMNWNDNTLSKIPGYRDRIVRVRLMENEGGMNLKMGDEKISVLSDFGEYAAEEIIERFIRENPVGPDDQVMGWENHRWIRLRSLVAMLEQVIPTLKAAVELAPPGAPSYGDQVLRSMTRGEHELPLSDDTQISMIGDLIRGIGEITDTLRRTTPTQSTALQPLPAIRIRPNL